MPTAFCTQADLEIAMGGAANLLEVSDPTKTGQIQTTIVTDYLETGAAEVRSITEVRMDPETLAQMDTDAMRLFIGANAALSARIAYEKGGLGQSMPEFVRENAERQERMLQQFRDGQRRIGRASGSKIPAINQNPGVVDYDKTGSGISITGFRKGFR